MISERFRIWVVDDDSSVLSILVMILKSAFPDILVRPFSKPHEAIAEAYLDDNTRLPNLLIVDHNMGSKTGEDVALALRARGVTDSIGISSNPEKQKYATLGVVSKPFNRDVLIGKIQPLIETFKNKEPSD